MINLKKEILELLEKDVEFRYAVAGYLGLLEVLKRLDSLTEEQTKLREEMSKVWNEIAGLREEQKKLREDMISGFKRYDERMEKLREDFHSIFHRFDLRLTRVERTLGKLTIDVEDEARSILKHRIKSELGLDVELSFLILPELELNIYGVRMNYV